MFKSEDENEKTEYLKLRDTHYRTVDDAWAEGDHDYASKRTKELEELDRKFGITEPPKRK